MLFCAMCLVACAGQSTVKPSPAPPTSASKPATAPSSTPVDASSSTKAGGYYLDDGPGANPPQDIDSIPNAVPRKEPLLDRSNKPYKALGAVYTPMTRYQPYKISGVASWYGKRYHGIVFILPLHAEFVLQQSGFTGKPEGWTSWSHRPESMPRVFVDTHVSRGEPGSLAINGVSNAAAYGGWRTQIRGVKPGEWFRFKAFYKAESVTAENWQVVARLDWQTAGGKRAGDPDYLPWTRRAGESRYTAK